MTPKRTLQFVLFCLAAVFTALSSAAKPPSYETESFDGNMALPATQARTLQTPIPKARVVPTHHSSWKRIFQPHLQILKVEYDSDSPYGRLIRITMGENAVELGHVRILEKHRSFSLKLGDFELNRLFGEEMSIKNEGGFDIRQESDYLSSTEYIASLIIDHQETESHVKIQANGIASEKDSATGETMYKTPDGLKIKVLGEHTAQARFTADKYGDSISCSAEERAQICGKAITQIRLMKLRSIKDIEKYMNNPA